MRILREFKSTFLRGLRFRLDTKLKHCFACQREKPANPEYFYRNQTTNDGLDAYCKECRLAYNREYHKEYDKEYRSKNKKRLKKYGKKYYAENKWKLKKYSKEYQKRNKEKFKEYRKEYRKKNKERINEYQRNRYHLIKNTSAYKATRKKHAEKYRRSEKGKAVGKAAAAKYSKTEKGRLAYARIRSKRRARTKSTTNSLTQGEWNTILQTFGNKCAYCRKNSNALQYDHIIPVSKGGGLTQDNTVPVCPSCNSSKGNCDLKPWMKKRGYDYDLFKLLWHIATNDP